MTAARPHIRPARDRHGHGMRGPLLPQQTPRYRSAREHFDMAVLEAYAPIQNAFAPQLRGPVSYTHLTLPTKRIE